MSNDKKVLKNPWLLYLGWSALCCLLFWRQLAALLHYSLNNDNASHILLVPVIVAWLLYLDRARLTKPSSFDFPASLLFLFLAAFFFGFCLSAKSLETSVRSSLLILSVILLLIAGFVAIFGRQSAGRVWFSFAFLGFAIPLPEALLNRIIYFLQYGSAAVAEWIFDWSGAPVLREGLVFHLPGFSIEVARECSGIRSSIALAILAILVAHFSFSRFWKKVIFVFAGLAVMVLKNGIRIATLTLLAKYVDPDFLYGRLHHEGGVVFFLIGLALLMPLYWILRRGEAPVLRTARPADAA